MIFITGATGFIGSYIANAYVAKGCTVSAIKRSNSDMSLLSEEAKNKIVWHDVALFDHEALIDILNNVETIIHAAAIVSFAPNDRKEMYRINIEGTASLVDAAIIAKVKKFIHISSVAAIARKKDVDLLHEDLLWEESEYNSHYAQTKFLSELEVWRGFEEGLKGFIVNPSVVIGPGFWGKGSASLFKYVYDEHKFYPKGKINGVDVRDVVEIIEKLDVKEVNHERFILNAFTIPYKSFFSKIAQLFNKKAPYIEAKFWMANLVWRLEWLKTFFTRKKPIITKETVVLSKYNATFDNSKIFKYISHNYRDIEDSLNYTCTHLKKNIVQK